MDLQRLKESVEAKMNKGLLSGRILLSNMNLPNEEFKSSSLFSEPKFYSFYYYLGTLIELKSIFELGFKLGFEMACLLKSCKTVNRFLAFHEPGDDKFHSRLGVKNIKKNYKNDFHLYVGSLVDDDFISLFKPTLFDLVFINEKVSYDKYRFYFDFLWPQISSDGFIIIEYLDIDKSSKKAYLDFCKAVNREPLIIKTRYGVGLIQK